MRNPYTHETYAPGNELALFLGRGYTGHEHLPWFGLINMNARLYDLELERFLSPDPYVQAPDFSQNFNRYSYCLNNPLMYVDEDGELAEWVALNVNGVIYQARQNYNNANPSSVIAGATTGIIFIKTTNHDCCIIIIFSIKIFGRIMIQTYLQLYR